MPLIRSLLTYVGITIWVILVGPPIILFALITGRTGPVFKVGHVGVQLGCALSGVRIEVSGREHIPPGRACVFAANHSSYVDGPIMFHVLGSRVRALAKAESFKLPVLGVAMRITGFAPIERTKREEAVKSLQQAARLIREGKSFFFFAEGTRSRTGTLQPFKKGGFIMAIEAQAPLVPVAIQGGTQVMPKGRGIIHPATVRVHITKPIETTGLTIEDRHRLIAEARARIEVLLATSPPAPATRPTPARADGAASSPVARR